MSQLLKPLILTDENGVETRQPGFWVDQKTGIIYYFASHGGKKIKFSTGCREHEWTKAKRFANQELARRLGKKRQVKVRSLISEEIPHWIAIKESEGLDEWTLRAIRRSRKRFERFWGDRFPLDLLDQDQRLEFYAWHAQEYPGQQLEPIIRYLRNFSRYLTQKVVDGVPLLPAIPKFVDPNAKLIQKERKKKRERIISSTEFRQIYAACNDEQKVACLWMYTMASRVEETLSLKFNEQVFIDLEEPVYRWQVGQNKADLDGEHLIHPALHEPLRRLKRRRDRQGTAFLFPQERDLQKSKWARQMKWESLRTAAGLDWHWTPHTFRHTCLSNLFNDERWPQMIVCKLYRISAKEAFRTYIKVTKQGREKLRAPIEVNL